MSNDLHSRLTSSLRARGSRWAMGDVRAWIVIAVVAGWLAYVVVQVVRLEAQRRRIRRFLLGEIERMDRRRQ